MKRIVLALLTIVVGLFITACSGGNDTSTESEGEGSTLIFARGADSLSLDAINVTDGESTRVTHNIYETLFKYDEKLELQPGLATEYELAEDELTWTLKLRKGVSFHDGTDFNADAVVFNFDRWMDPNHPEHNGEFTYYSFLYGGFKGDQDHKIEYVKAIDDYTVEIKLTEPTAPFISYLAIPMFGMASPEAVQKYGENYDENPVGTGPFVFDSWTRNDKILLSKNEDYYVEDIPRLDQLIFRVIPDNSARFTALQTGEVDMIDGLSPDDADLVKSDGNLDLVKRPGFNIGYLAFNMEKEPFNNPKVRKALNYAINKDSIIDAFYNGMAEKAVNPIPPSLWGYNEEIDGYSYDPEKAKELLAEAGLEGGFTTELWAMSNPRPYMPQPLKIAEAIQSDLAEVGVEIDINTYEWATYLDKTSNGEHDMALFGWTGVMADPDNFLFPNLSKTNATKPANNRAFYKNEEFTNLLLKARTTFDEEERIQLYKEAQEIFYDDAPWALIGHTTPPLAKKEYVKGFVAHPMSDDAFWDVYLTN
ncbi:ABC transporter substrate-binding protein [Pseudalkalibacillus hwajinpoensis]|uniref:ABC transporter substrate-binding protein n=1 Tax=Guptibacillus hwajinpoensis TaxID=208199 RepID=UPI001F0D7342|nr:ABC transporter substrate-binding protein [Pseudalkalibacillus hwajinpoensis]